jgi:atypical dual specificity phosphatase
VSDRRLDYSRLGARLLAGRLPFLPAHVEALRAEGVTSVINLCEEREYWDGERDAVLAAYRDAEIREQHLPVVDGSSVMPAVLQAAVDAARDGTVYVHCRGGRERSAAVAIAVVVATEGLSVDDALRHVRERRPQFAPLPWQVEALRAWAGELESP